jgi:hypothetical protein
VAQQSIFCKQNTIKLSIVDAGVNYDFPLNTNLISAKMGWNTVFLHGPAMRHGTAIVLKQGRSRENDCKKQVVIALVLVKWE